MGSRRPSTIWPSTRTRRSPPPHCCKHTPTLKATSWHPSARSRRTRSQNNHHEYFRLQIRMAIFLAAFLLVPLLTHADTCVNGQLIDNVGNVTGTCTSPDSDSQTADQAAQATYSARYQFQNEGIFGCNQIAGVNMSVGTMAAIGGIYVPVNDAAVTVNTGTLVYLECILRPLVDRLRESETSATLKKMTSGIPTQRNGGPQYSVNRAQEDTSVAAQEAYRVLTDGTLNAVSPAYFTKVRTALARNIQMQMQKPESALTRSE